MHPENSPLLLTRRSMLASLTSLAGAATLGGCAKRDESPSTAATTPADHANDEYVWISPHANLPLYMAHDHPALQLAGKVLGVKVTIAGPNTLDIPSFVSAIETTAARRPKGIMINAWDPSAVIAPIKKVISMGVPLICVDGDAPQSDRISFVGTNWYDVGVRQGEAMAKALGGRRGKVAMIGLTEQYIDQQAFAGFRSVVEKTGATVMEPQHDRGDSAMAARVCSSLIQSTPDLIGIAGFDSESGPGAGVAIKEAGKSGKVVATCVDAEAAHLNLIKEGVLAAAVGQKRELFTYYGLKLLFDLAHPQVRLSPDDQKAGIRPVPEIVHVGTYTVTRENVDVFLRT